MGQEDACRRVLDGALDAVIATDREGAIVGWNRAAETLLGWPKAEVVGRKVYDVIVPARHRDAFIREMGQVRVEDVREYRERVIVGRDGREIPVDASIAATRLDGCVVVTAFVRDMSERKRAERLRETEHRLTRLLATSPSGRELTGASQPIIAQGLGWAAIEGWMLADGELRLVGRWGVDGREPAAELAERTRAARAVVREPGALAAPVVIGGEVLGVTVLRDEPARVARDDEAAALAGMSDQLGQYGERRMAEWRREAENAAVAEVARATRRLSMATTSAEARQALCDAARHVCASSVAFLAEPDPDSDELVVTAIAGATPSVSGVPGRLGRGTAIHRVHVTGSPLFTVDAQADPRAFNDAARAAGVLSAQAQPLRRGDNALGVLAVAWGERVERTSEHVRLLLGILADEGAIALSRAEVFTGLATAARTDPLTGLANLRGWDEALAREVARAARTGRPFSVAMLDIDGLKEINDAGGHQAGDRALRESVSAWRSAVRDSDLLARLGGDEFAVALPDCDRVGAQLFGERLRQATPGPQTCSVGAAQWRKGETAEALCQRADQALYAAKDNGRNRTIAAP